MAKSAKGYALELYALYAMLFAQCWVKHEMQVLRQGSQAQDWLTRCNISLHGVRQGISNQRLPRGYQPGDVGGDLTPSQQQGIIGETACRNPLFVQQTTSFNHIN
jgi:hypothetical protein